LTNGFTADKIEDVAILSQEFSMQDKVSEILDKIRPQLQRSG